MRAIVALLIYLVTQTHTRRIGHINSSDRERIHTVQSQVGQSREGQNRTSTSAQAWSTLEARAGLAEAAKEELKPGWLSRGLRTLALVMLLVPSQGMQLSGGGNALKPYDGAHIVDAAVPHHGWGEVVDSLGPNQGDTQWDGPRDEGPFFEREFTDDDSVSPWEEMAISRWIEEHKPQVQQDPTIQDALSKLKMDPSVKEQADAEISSLDEQISTLEDEITRHLSHVATSKRPEVGQSDQIVNFERDLMLGRREIFDWAEKAGNMAAGVYLAGLLLQGTAEEASAMPPPSNVPYSSILSQVIQVGAKEKLPNVMDKFTGGSHEKAEKLIKELEAIALKEEADELGISESDLQQSGKLNDVEEMNQALTKHCMQTYKKSQREHLSLMLSQDISVARLPELFAAH